MNYYENKDELMHYGVMGMKWGIRRARRKEAKANYKRATDKAFSKYEKEINSIEKNYKRGQNLSKKDQAREAKAEADYQKAASKAKAEYKKAKSDHSKDTAIANKLYSKQSKEANKRVAEMPTGKALAESYLLGSYGALKYNEARGKGNSKGEAAVKAILYQSADNFTGGLNSTAKYLDNRWARKKK